MLHFLNLSTFSYLRTTNFIQFYSKYKLNLNYKLEKRLLLTFKYILLNLKHYDK